MGADMALGRPESSARQQPVRLAELLGTLSLVTDLARGHEYEHALRSCLVAARAAAVMGLTEHERRDVYWTALLRSVGCTATSHEYAAVFGDDVAIRRRGDITDATRPAEAIRMLLATNPRRGRVVERARQLAVAFREGQASASEGARADCEVGSSMARRFGLPESVSTSIAEIWERWDGKGSPGRKRGNAIAIGARIATAATVAVLFDSAFGRDDGRTALRGWSGRALDPAAVEVLCTDDVREALMVDDPIAAVVAAEPGRVCLVGDHDLDEVARGFAEFVDLKSPYFHGHSESVGQLAADAGRLAGLDEPEQRGLDRAGLLHDLGRAGVSSATWEKAGRLGRGEWEQVRLHAYHSERILSPLPVLAPLARLAGLHHERPDGSGYHRGLPAALLDRPARLLAAADVYTALRSVRPHRAARSDTEAIRELEASGFGRETVDAVVSAAGGTPSRRRESNPAGLTEREVEILRLLAGGQTERQIAQQLVVSQSTVHTHVVHIYEKAGVTTRAAVAVFAMQHDLIRPF